MGKQMNKKTLKYVDKMVCFQEVPDETTLSFSISNCPHKCPGCHSSYLAEDIGIPLKDELEKEINFHDGLITCILFMGGDDPAQVEDLKECADYCRNRGYKTALYSGAENIPEHLWDYFDYVKIGPYKQELGGLDHKTTNQRMYKNVFGKWEDITYKFWQKGLKVN